MDPRLIVCPSRFTLQPKLRRRLSAATALGFVLLWPHPGSAQTAPGPAGTDSPAKPQAAQRPADGISTRDLHAASDAYLKGARALDHRDFLAAETEFARAARLNPFSEDYAIALAATREHRLTDLVQRAAAARVQGKVEEANRLLLQARDIDPQNSIVQQHFAADGTLVPAPSLTGEPIPGANARLQEAAGLDGPVQLAPAATSQSFHLHASAHDLLIQVCAAYGIRATVVNSIDSGPALRFDLDKAQFSDALRVVQTLTHTFSVPLQSKELLFSRDTPENRAQYLPLLEETLYLPGTTQESMTEYANLVRNVFNLRVVNAVSNAGSLVLRGDEDTLRHVNATFADLIDDGSDVVLDLSVFEVDRTHVRNLGVQLPSSIGAFPVAATAQNLINANQSLISEAIANNLITLTGNSYTDALTELEFLLASGTVNSSQFSNLLGTFGHYGGLPLAGVFLGSTSTVNAALTSSDVRMLDLLQLRLGDKQEGQFRAGSRYPIETGIYSSNLAGNVGAAVAGLTINGTSVSSLLSQYLGSTSAAIPQIQYEDLGLTLKATPQVMRTGDVSLKLDFKLEALGSGSINTLPILNNRQLTSTVTIPQGKTAILASVVSTSELRALTGLPFLIEIPGFQTTNKDVQKDTMELLIVMTPHVVRNRNVQVTSRRLLLANGSGSPAANQ